MYGMVNSALRALIVSKYGPEAWQQIRTAANVEDEFGAMQQLADEITYRLVAEASECLEKSQADVLEEFGQHWIVFARSQGYEALLLGSEGLFDFLETLDDLHTRLSLSFADYTPPSFYCTDRGATTVRLHYVSERDGLAPFVVGLLRGLSALYSTPLRITQKQAKADGADHDVFHLELEPS